jgi:hypothetical protein
MQKAKGKRTTTTTKKLKGEIFCRLDIEKRMFNVTEVVTNN